MKLGEIRPKLTLDEFDEIKGKKVIGNNCYLDLYRGIGECGYLCGYTPEHEHTFTVEDKKGNQQCFNFIREVIEE